ncbi:uncharacterized protein BO87DRAFT_373833 [Aspergillus neoniger CBS 115656]|uniref:Uncharacterized protein n=1 Tax=Aspergillus neoniger (strain CBS 115656) TaxID=1448310 RepID=A0A318Z0K5_ASPNB|nr:hypothetical protein BO87DRAFT_373833 [Aspergillus neoniger CBS 115656]PYH37460.1 hypothetical protein BO87DRAFT_373833 [Aspergillus neoniger CBS 115656]
MATVTFKDDLPNTTTTTTTTTPKNKTTTLRRWLTFSTSTSSSHHRSSSPRPKPTRRPTPKPTINTTNTNTTGNSNSTTTRLYRRVTLPRRSSKSKTKTRTIHPDDTHTPTPTSLLTSINTTTNTGTPTAHPLVSTNPITPPPTSPTSPSSTTNNNKIRSRSPLSPLSPLSLNFSTLFNLSPRSKTIEESSSSTYSSSVSEIHIPPPTVSHEQLTSSYAEYCEAFTEGRTEESFLYQEGEKEEEDGDKGVRPVKEIVIKGEKGCLEERCLREKGGRGGQCVDDTKEEERKGNGDGDGDSAIPCSDDQREILHWLRESDEEQDSGSNAEDVPLRVSPPARILTPARYEQSRRAARQPQHGKQQEHHEDQRHAWWTALRVGWTRMRRRTSKAANPDYN